MKVNSTSIQHHSLITLIRLFISVTTCPDLNLNHANKSTSDTTSGTSVDVTCELGYRALTNQNSSTTLTCSSRGIWVPSFTDCLRKYNYFIWILPWYNPMLIRSPVNNYIELYNLMLALPFAITCWLPCTSTCWFFHILRGHHHKLELPLYKNNTSKYFFITCYQTLE